MRWLKNVILDLAVTLLIVFAVTQEAGSWARTAVLVYTPFMLLLKAFAFFGNLGTLGRRPAAEAPPWFFHLLYAVNVVFLFAARWWLPAVGWVLIWALAAATEARARRAAERDEEAKRRTPRP